MNGVRRVATGYLAAWTTGNVENALALASDDFILKTAMQTTHGKAALGVALEHFAPLARGAHTLQQFATGRDVCTIFELEVNLSDATRTILISEIDTVDDDRVTQSLLIFDSASLQASAAQGPRLNPEVDPVCGMTVVSSTTEATRRSDNIEYRFCSIACADAFDRNPQRYHRQGDASRE